MKKKKFKSGAPVIVSPVESALYDYAEDLKIDLLQLDLEFEEQPRKFMRYARAASDARKQKDLAKKKMAIRQAKIRVSLMKVNSRATKEMVDEKLLQTEEWTRYKKWSYRHEILEDAKQAFWQRKSAIEGEIDLIRMEYFAKPRVPRDLETIIERREKTKKRVGRSLNKKEE